MLSKGTADVNELNGTDGTAWRKCPALFQACKKGHLEIVKLLLAHERTCCSFLSTGG